MFSNKLETILAAALSDADTDKIKYTKLTPAKCRDMLIKNCHKSLVAYGNDNGIYRGDFYLVDSEGRAFYAVPGNRVSENTINIYTKLFSDVLESWSSYPKRNKSFICSTSVDKARRHSDSSETYFGIFPLDNAKLGVCPQRDLWFSFEELKKLDVPSLSIFNNEAANFMKINRDIVLNVLNKNLVVPSFIKESRTEIIAFFTELDETVKALVTTLGKDKYVKTVMDSKGIGKVEFTNTWIDAIIDEKGTYSFFNDDILNPVKNNIRCLSLNDFFNSNEYTDNEVWTDSACIFIRNSEKDKIIIPKALASLK